eukprot:8105627-Heterocapsa_arctica.AAC.1
MRVAAVVQPLAQRVPRHIMEFCGTQVPKTRGGGGKAVSVSGAVWNSGAPAKGAPSCARATGALYILSLIHI